MLTDARRSLLLSAMRDAARTAVLPRFRALEQADIATKSNPTDLVTIADREAEASIAARLAADWPEALVVGEESVSANPQLLDRLDGAEWAVIVDPVDGTWNYANGLALFGMIVAVIHRGVVVWGALYDPLLDDWVEASDRCEMVTGAGARRTLHASVEADPKAMNGYVPLGLFDEAMRRKMVLGYPDFGRVSALRCSCHEYRLVAQGRSDFVLSGPVPNVWDHAAGVLAVVKAGGVVRFADGSDYDPLRRRGVVIAAGSERAWAVVAEKFACVSGI